MFHVGQKVVCVVHAAAWNVMPTWWRGPMPELPVYYREYTIRSMFEDPMFKPSLALRFEEILLLESPAGQEAGFGAFNTDGSPHFIPIEQRKTDIAIFRKMLIGGPKEVVR